MKASFIRRTGTPDVIEYGDLPEPECGAKQVRIAVHSVAVNPVDTYIRGGANYWPLPMPFIIGCDMAGEVVEVGAEVSDVSLGQRVWCTNQGLLGRQGTFAQQVVVDPQWLNLIENNVSYDDAASTALVAVTAHLGLFREANLLPGQTVFIVGGTGGVGSMVVQMAAAFGARVITTGGSAEKVQRCYELGADVAINYKQVDLQQALLDATDGAGVNVFWETRREPNFDFATAVLAQRGKMILMAGRDARPEFPVGPFYVKGCSIHGFVMFKATADEMRVCGADISQWLSNGKLKSQIAMKLPLSEAKRAHQIQEASTTHQDGSLAGKIVLNPAL